MPISTLEELQTLKDAEFHALADEILPRISPNYHPLVPFGRNEKGDSIIGQPDSYVGDTAKTCRIAVQYTVQEKSWWTKVIEDVEEARKACPKAQEIVVVLPRDIDREGPTKGKNINWYQEAMKIASPAEFTLIHGRKLEQQLNTSCQDLRFIYLGIPFSRLSWHALMTGCREASTITLQRLKSLGRYDSKRYVDRESDDHFFRLWQKSLRMATGRSSYSNRRLLIPLIADSGIGKTSLLARFTERTSSHRPVLLLLARDLSFDRSDSLITQVMERLQGSMDARSRSTEESYLAKMLAGKTPITVILDGIDETTNVEGLRQSINTWLLSKLGKSSILVISSRPEFWRKCRDATWSKHILRESKHPKAAKSLRHEKELSTLDPMKGIELPGKFSQQEQLKVWRRGGQNEDKFWQLPKEVRKELLHPFTLRSVLDLINTDTSLDQLQTRSAIMDLWITSRLKSEKDDETRVTKTQFRNCLLIIARIAASNNNSWVSIDNLEEVPRFSRSHPPGPAVEKLISANLLETHPEHHDQIRFSFEAVQDFFLAESMVCDIENAPEEAAKEFAKLSFTEAVTRLERIGDQIASQSFREQFIRSLAELDAPKAAVVLRSATHAYSTECRQFVVSKVAELLNSRMEAERALATELLGRLICQESKNVIEAHWTENKPSKRMHRFVSSAAISQGILSLIPCVFRTWWFSRDRLYVNLRPELMATTQNFRDSLADYALNFIPSENHSDEYQRALMVLSYLGDERAVDAIKQRTNGTIPFFYESMCLLAIGSSKAIEVYSSLIDRYFEAKKGGIEKEQVKDWRNAVTPHAQIGNLVTPEVEEFVSNQINSDNTERQLIGHFLARWLGTERLLLQKVKHWPVQGYTMPHMRDFGSRLGAENWIKLWKQSSNKKEKKTLIKIARDLYDTRVEEILIGCLDDVKLAGQCAQSLASIGSQRACPNIRNFLTRERNVDNDKDWTRYLAFRALATLRDPASVDVMVEYLESNDNTEEHNGTVGLASIGTEKAENALLGLKNQPDELLVRGLVHYGSRKCIKRAINITKQRDRRDGAQWLVEQCRFCFMGFHGRSRRQYRTDVDIEPFLDFVLADEPNENIYEYLRSILNKIDSPTVRRLLKEWYDLQNTPDDIILNSQKDFNLSDYAFQELADRGDSYVLTEYIEKEIDRYRDFQIHNHVIKDLSFFDRAKVRSTLRTMLREKNDDKSLRVIIDLIGHVGDQQVDIGNLNRLIESESDIIANAAFEAKLRLTDPLRLAEHW